MPDSLELYLITNEEKWQYDQWRRSVYAAKSEKDAIEMCKKEHTDFKIDAFTIKLIGVALADVERGEVISDYSTM